MIEDFRIIDSDWNVLLAHIQEIITTKKITDENEIIQEVQKSYTHNEKIILTAIKSAKSFLEAYNLYLKCMHPLNYGDNRFDDMEMALFEHIQGTGIRESIIKAAIRKGRSELKKRAFEFMSEIAERRVSSKDRFILPHEMAGRIVDDEFKKPINKRLFGILIVVVAEKIKELNAFHNKNLKRYEEKTCGAL